MSTALAEARELALSLNETDRFELAHELFGTLEYEFELDFPEISRRIGEVRNGTADLVTMEELEKSMQEAIHGAHTAHS